MIATTSVMMIFFAPSLGIIPCPPPPPSTRDLPPSAWVIWRAVGQRFFRHDGMCEGPSTPVFSWIQMSIKIVVELKSPNICCNKTVDAKWPQKRKPRSKSNFPSGILMDTVAPYLSQNRTYVQGLLGTRNQSQRFLARQGFMVQVKDAKFQDSRAELREILKMYYTLED